MIDFNNVSKTYPNGTHALYDVSIHIDKGEFAFIVGASGAGKSTFLKLIMHEESPSSGEIIVNNLNITKMRRRKVPYLRRHMGIVFQDFRLIDKMNVFDNVAFAMRAIGASASSIKKRVPYILELVGLKNKMKNPEIIIADEPTGNVDPEMSHDIIQLLSEINDMGTTVLVVTHEHELVRQFNKRVIVIDHGRVKSDTKNPEAALAYDAQYEDIDEIIEGIALSKETKENFVDNDVVPD